MPLQLPGLSTLYAIHRRDIERRNDVLAQRKELAGELVSNCRTWAQALLDTFDQALEKWKAAGRDQAAAEIEALQEDFMRLDYWSLEESSPALKFLKEDSRFSSFVSACAEFYRSALSVKRLVYGQIQTGPGRYVSSSDVGLRGMVSAWHGEVERMLREVSIEHMKVRIITPT